MPTGIARIAPTGWCVVFAAWLVASLARASGPFEKFLPPGDWQTQFWAQPEAKRLLEMDGKALAELVPTQAGLRYCRCPKCGAAEIDAPLTWSLQRPDELTCRFCRATFPKLVHPPQGTKAEPAKDPKASEGEAKKPADSKSDEKAAPEQDKAKEKEKAETSDKGKDKDEKSKEATAKPESEGKETVEVRPGIVHTYPYVVMEVARQAYPDERAYLLAKRDYEAREFLGKAAFYAAARHHRQPDASFARLSSILLLQFARTYPLYATHRDQPGRPKLFQPADLPPPYRAGYETAKWDWSGAFDVPLNLVIAYSLLRDDPALIEAGRLLGDPQPRRTIDRDLFQASARFVRAQPVEGTELALCACRGLLAVGRLLDDPESVHDAVGRLDAVAHWGFYHDGLWREGDAASHHRVLALIDGWIDPLLSGYSDPPGYVSRDGRHLVRVAGTGSLAQVRLARIAGNALLTASSLEEVRRASWPALTPANNSRQPTLLGGAGLARLSVGAGSSSIDVEMRGMGSLDNPKSARLSMRLAVGGQLLVGDRDDLPSARDGFDRATASHTSVLVDGLNQRESITAAKQPALGSDVLFFAADPDFQVAAMADRFAYPTATTRYRQILVAVASTSHPYVVSIYDVEGGLRHDQLLHAAPGVTTDWRLNVPSRPGPDTLLPPSVRLLPRTRAEDGRWFVQGLGLIGLPLVQAYRAEPCQAFLKGEGESGVCIHLLDDVPFQAVIGRTNEDASEGAGRSVLVDHHEPQTAGTVLHTRFVTVFEGVRAGVPPLERVGRVGTDAEAIVLAIQDQGALEHLVVNLHPGTRQTTRLADGRTVATDGLVVRVDHKGGLSLAGGTIATCDRLELKQERVAGTIRAVLPGGFFLADGTAANPDTLTGRALIVRHGDGTSRGWTIAHAENLPGPSIRFHVLEDTGFQIDPQTHLAQYDQFPCTSHPGPHAFSVCRIAR